MYVYLQLAPIYLFFWHRIRPIIRFGISGRIDVSENLFSAWLFCSEVILLFALRAYISVSRHIFQMYVSLHFTWDKNTNVIKLVRNEKYTWFKMCVWIGLSWVEWENWSTSAIWGLSTVLKFLEHSNLPAFNESIQSIHYFIRVSAFWAQNDYFTSNSTILDYVIKLIHMKCVIICVYANAVHIYANFSDNSSYKTTEYIWWKITYWTK